MLALFQKSTGELVESSTHAEAGALTATAIVGGYSADDLEEVETTEAELLARLAPSEAEQAVTDAKKELEQLDLYIPRSVEDLIDAGVIQETSLSAYNQTRLARKRELRGIINA